jgi:hypothetical protein
VFDSVKFNVLDFGGDCGGSTVTDGGGAEIVDTGLGRRFLVGDGDKFAGSFRGG